MDLARRDFTHFLPEAQPYMDELASSSSSPLFPLLSRNAILKLQTASLVILIIKYQVLSNSLDRSLETRGTQLHCVRSSFEIKNEERNTNG